MIKKRFRMRSMTIMMMPDHFGLMLFSKSNHLHPPKTVEHSFKLGVSKRYSSFIRIDRRIGVLNKLLLVLISFIQFHKNYHNFSSDSESKREP